MSKLNIEKIRPQADNVEKLEIKSPANQKYFELYEKNIDKLKAALNEYNLAYQKASTIYVP